MKIALFAVVFGVTYLLSDWLCDKLIAFIKKKIKKRKEKKWVKYVKNPLDDSTISVDELMK